MAAQKITKEGVLVGRQTWDQVTKENQDNILILVERINQLIATYPGPIKINDGLRRSQDRPTNGSATSWHYKGAAIDLDDDDSAVFWHWLKDRLPLLKECKLWIEDPRWTHGSVGTWMHFQIYAPMSGNRIFVPSSKPAAAPALWDGKYDPALNGKS